MLVALVITWVWWLFLAGVLIYKKRSWLCVLFFPLLFSVFIWQISKITEKAALVFSILVNGFFIVGTLVAVIKEKMSRKEVS